MHSGCEIMSQIIAENILSKIGPGKILHYACSTPKLVSALLQKGCDAWGYSSNKPEQESATLNGRISDDRPTKSFDSLILDHQAIASCPNIELLLQELRPLVANTLVILPAHSPTPSSSLDIVARSKSGIEQAAINAGYRRHPATYAVIDYAQYDAQTPNQPMFFQIVTDATLAIWPQDQLVSERDLHMDMTREPGPRADAHMVRYALAAEWVRPSDTVLDCACGLGYGTAMLAARSAGMSFIGIDIDAASIAYARDNFSDYQIDFRTSSAICLDFLKDNSIDLAVSFETLEHLEDYSGFLQEIARVLKPDGRVIVSVPNLWIDKTGFDPNPYHHHVFDYEKCRTALARHFLIEARYAQTAPGGMKLPNASRKLWRLPLTATDRDPDTEWWILVASVNPIQGATVPFSRPEYDRCTEGTGSTVAAFDTCYDNPWLYRAWMQIGLRLSDEHLLDMVIEEALPTTAPSSADRGGLLAVKAYSALRKGCVREYNRILQDITGYLDNPTDNPHVLRWCISLAFVAALLSLAQGQRLEAMHFLDRVTAMDPLRFSPLIATKLLAAHFLAGTMHLVDQNENAAQNAFVAGIEAARRALHAPDVNAIGNPLHPLAFGFVELAEIADMASQCALAIDALPRFRRSPALFWRSMDARRFGMISWLRALQDHNQYLDAEIDALRSEMHLLRSSSTIRALLPKRIKEVILIIIPRLIRRLIGRKR